MSVVVALVGGILMMLLMMVVKGGKEDDDDKNNNAILLNLLVTIVAVSWTYGNNSFTFIPGFILPCHRPTKENCNDLKDNVNQSIVLISRAIGEDPEGEQWGWEKIRERSNQTRTIPAASFLYI
ncbi:hypothetical protein CHS0354_013540 [Potamilus streckersoni]|uniref:Uncharacterized protein n=1 Tax=Potamilus streckersoni TaxID=2493646 RepID=A0AAE0T8R8_9BIVA|nr:hypothetical protein CHS0354_013540 [Potamilus streckersoni]